MPFTWYKHNFTNDSFTILTISYAKSHEKYIIPPKIDLENEQFHMPFTWNKHNFTHNSPRILTISYAINLKYTEF